MSEEKENTKKVNFLQIFMIVLIVILTIGIIVQIILLVDYKNKIEQYREENKKLEELLTETKENKTFQKYINEIENQML